MKFIPIETGNGEVWMISPDNLDWISGNINSCGCNFNVMGARLLHMEYPNYLRYLRSRGAELRGKTGFCHAVFKDKTVCQSICNELNVQWNKIKKYVEG